MTALTDANIDARIEAAIREHREGCNRLRGELFGLIDATIASDRQADALKTLVRRHTYSAQADIEATLRNL